MASNWIAYNDLAWTEELLTDPAQSGREASMLVGLIHRQLGHRPLSLLHLGCGAGGYDGVFKRHFVLTGVDLSQGMLEIARQRHPDVEYIEGDMRSLRLQRQFDAVVIPDGIDYMASLAELRMAMDTAAKHLKPGGVLLVVCKTRETFSDNSFAYTGEQGDLHVTLLENNHVCRLRPDGYEATLVYLIRRQDDLTIHTERHELGLFAHGAWRQVFADVGLSLSEVDLDGSYDRYLLGEGKYPMKLFIGVKEEGRKTA